jgi:glycosyltransferase involved in cell wall biosynthesis
MNSNVSTNVIFYIYYEDLNVLGPYLYAAKLWHERGYDVHIYSLHNEKQNDKIPAGVRKYFQHHTVTFPFCVRILSKLAKGIGFFFKIIGVRARGGKWASLIKMSYFAFYCFLKSKKIKNSILIATDPPGLWVASLISKKTNCSYIYSIREIFLSADNNDVVDRIVKHFERKANRNALFTVEFDETRAGLIQKDNYLSPEKMKIVPNTPIGEAINKRCRYLRKKLNIPDDKKIALYTGGIADYNLTYEHIESTETWPDNVVLIMHCWGRKEEIWKLKEFAQRFKRGIYFSTDRLPFDEIDMLYSSADIGFALYGDQDLNHKYTGMASGKMFNFMQACVPIITNNTTSCKKAVEETGCGVCIEDIKKVGDAIQKILEREGEYRRNCQKAFSVFSFIQNYKILMDAIEDRYRDIHDELCF